MDTPYTTVPVTSQQHLYKKKLTSTELEAFFILSTKKQFWYYKNKYFKDISIEMW